MWGTLFSAFLMKGKNSVGYTLFCLLSEGRKQCGVKKGEKSVGESENPLLMLTG